MKRILLITMLILVAVGIYADYLVKVDLNGVSNRQLRVMELSRAGFEVYYYNSVAMIGKADDKTLAIHNDLGISQLIPLPTELRFYVVTKLENQPQMQLPASLHILADLGDSWLISTSQDEVNLRDLISNPFLILALQPIRLQPERAQLPQNRTPERSIEDLVDLVHPDSVMWFIQTLQNFQTRYALAPNRLAVATWIHNQFLRLGISNAQIVPFQWNGTTQYNVVATIVGTQNPEKYVIVGGHHDSIVNNGDPYTFAPGADDNASGTVAALEMARVIMTGNYQPNNSIRFVTFAAEEFGLWGSKNYAENALQNEQNILLMINHDMIAYSVQNPVTCR